MAAFTLAKTICAPPERVYDFVADLAAWPAVVDHFVDDFRLARANPVGRGAAARFRVRSPYGKPYAELDIYAAERPRELLLRVRYGRVGRNRAAIALSFMAEEAGCTRLELQAETYPMRLADRLRDALCGRWLKRRVAEALERLRMVFEEPPSKPLLRASIAGFEPEKGPRFGAHAGSDPRRGRRWAGERSRDAVATGPGPSAPAERQAPVAG